MTHRASAPTPPLRGVGWGLSTRSCSRALRGSLQTPRGGVQSLGLGDWRPAANLRTQRREIGGYPFGDE